MSQTDQATPYRAAKEPGSHKRGPGWIKVLVSAALMAVLLTQIQVQDIVEALVGIRWVGLWAALALFIAGIFIRAYRWQILLTGLDLPVPLRTLSALYFVGSFFNTVLPTGFGGDAVKAAELAHTSGRAGEAVGTVVIDRFLGIVVLLAMGVAALLLAGDWVDPRLTWALAILFVASLAGYWLLRQSWLLKRLRPLLPQRLTRPLEKTFRALYEGLQGYSRKTLAKALLVSFIFNVSWIGVNVLLGWSLSIQATLVQYLVFVPLVSLSLLLPSVGGLGVRELTYVGLFGLVGVPEEKAFALGLLVYAVNVATGLIGGTIYLAQGLSTHRRKGTVDSVAVESTDNA